MKNLKNIFISLLISIGFVLSSCESIVDGINDNPNDLVTEDVNPKFFLNGALLANSVAQAGHLNRIAGMYSGQLIGFTSLYANIYGYSLSSAESVTTWSRIYIGVIPNVRLIRKLAADDPFFVGVSKIVEAHAVGTAASLFGDVPYSEVNREDIADPKFDSQAQVFRDMIALLDDALADLNSVPNRSEPFDLYYGGNAGYWRAAANTLKARYYLQLKEYSNAYQAAQNGISSAEESMKYIPRGDPSFSEGDKNLFWTILEGSRTGDIGTGDSYLMQLINPTNASSRNNAKTDETARFGYYTIDETGGRANLGIIEQFEPHNLVTYQENLLILAETGARTSGFNTGLGHLNDLRAFLNTGGFLNSNFINSPYSYQPYEAADFASGGMENEDGLSAERALLREIIEERYVSGFGMYMPFNDARRLMKSDADIAVPFPLNNSSATMNPQRMPYSNDELNSNSNAPSEDPGIFVITEVNK